MGIIIAFAPFIAFAIVDRLIGSVPGLVCGALVSGLLLLRETLILKRSAKLLEIGTALLFSTLAVWAACSAGEWSIVGVRLRVDLGLLAIVLASIAIRRPFTLQYARERVEPAKWNDPAFLRTNLIISAAWALAFGLLVVADVLMLALPDMPTRVGVWMTVGALVGAVKFSAWYPERLSLRSASPIDRGCAP